MPNTRNGAVKGAAKITRRATAKAEKTVDHATDRVRQFADDAISNAESQIAAAQEATAEYLKEGRVAVESVSDLVREYVKSQPVKSLAIAAGAGMVLSMILRRR